jgi:hypothetical protein
MALSSKEGKIYLLAGDCPVDLEGNAPAGTTQTMESELTDFDFTPSAASEEYAHDKSFGWQDLCFGTKRLEGTIVVKVRPASPIELGPAQFAYLELYPLGRALSTKYSGYAGIESTPMKVSIKDGKPVEVTYKFKSRGKWHGLPNDSDEWGGFECSTEDSGSVG